MISVLNLDVVGRGPFRLSPTVSHDRAGACCSAGSGSRRSHAQAASYLAKAKAASEGQKSARRAKRPCRPLCAPSRLAARRRCALHIAHAPCAAYPRRRRRAGAAAGRRGSWGVGRPSLCVCWRCWLRRLGLWVCAAVLWGASGRGSAPPMSCVAHISSLSSRRSLALAPPLPLCNRAIAMGGRQPACNKNDCYNAATK